MKIYAAEKDIEHLIKAEAKATIYSKLERFTDFDKLKDVQKSVASDYSSFASIDDPDLYITKSVLVSTNWNKNDDVFLKAHVWAARHTPSHKPTNLNHDETQLVGHITANWAVDKDYNIIPDDTKVEDLPDFFHICNAAVIYLHWDDAELVSRAQELIEEIEAGTKYVSMECRFKDFDYALKKGDEVKILARCEETAFLTKKLRAYAGTGEHDGYKVGRVPKKITFSGKGYVDKPANTHSIIFNESLFSTKSGVLDNDVNNENEVKEDMSDFYKEQAEKLQARVDELTKELKIFSEKASAQSLEKYENTIKTLEESVAAYKEGEDKMKKEKKDMKAQCEELEAKVKELEEANAGLKTQITAFETEKAKAERISTLVDGGYEKEVATAKVEKFTRLSDDEFAALAEELIAAKKVEPKTEAETKTEKTETEAAAEVIETVDETKTSEDTATAGVTTEEKEDKRTNVEKAFASLREKLEQASNSKK